MFKAHRLFGKTLLAKGSTLSLVLLLSGCSGDDTPSPGEAERTTAGGEDSPSEMPADPADGVEPAGSESSMSAGGSPSPADMPETASPANMPVPEQPASPANATPPASGEPPDQVPQPPMGNPVPPAAELFEANFLWAALDLTNAPDQGHVPQAIANAVAAGDINFEEIGEDVGLADAVGGGNMHGVGVGFVDINNDGWDDLFVINGQIERGGLTFASHLYRNNAGTFVDASASSGFAAIMNGVDGYSIAAADYDTDGDLDIYIGAKPTDILLQNDGDGNFTNVTQAAGAGGPNAPNPGTASKIVTFGDFNGDGLPDIASTYNVGGRGSGYLLANAGDGTFTNVTEQTAFIPSASGNPCAMMWSDYDNDGDQDIWIWNDRGNATGNRSLLRNDAGSFTNVTASAGINNNVSNPMGIDAVDVNRDGMLDYYVSNIGEGRGTGNPLFMSNGDGTFENDAPRAGVVGDFGWGLGFEDFNGDEWPDIFVAQEDNRPYLGFQHNGDNPPTFTRH